MVMMVVFICCRRSFSTVEKYVYLLNISAYYILRLLFLWMQPNP